MAIARVWAIAFFFISMVILAWAVTQPLAYRTVVESRKITRDMEANTTGYENTMTILLYVNNFWAPVLVIVFILWALVSSQRREEVTVFV